VTPTSFRRDGEKGVQAPSVVLPDNKIFLGDRKRWGIVENVPRDVLVERGEGARRPMALPKRVSP
jgi:hypothetical protein